MLRIFSKCCFSTKNYYQLLGVKRDATTDEIKKQFHQLAKQYHPDSPNSKESDSEMFKSITAAYTILSDDNERIKYDRTLNESEQQQEARSGQQQSTQQQTTYQRPINPNAQFYYDFRKKSQNFEERDFQRQKQNYIEDNPLFHSMRKSPELYVVSLVFFVIMWRLYGQMVDERTQSRYQSFPEDPEFIKEKERDYQKRYGFSPYPKKQILYKVTKSECRNIPIDILDEMDNSGRYNMDPACFERLDKFRSEQGTQVIQMEQSEDEDSVQQYLKLSKKKQHKRKDDDDEDDNESDVAEMYKQARVFNMKKIRGLNANHIDSSNIKDLQKL